MSSLKQVRLLNIQSHIDTLLDFPETGIIRIYGDNSNGKSVMVKVLWAGISNEITKPKCRSSLIRRGNMYGEALYERYDGMKLKMHVHHEAAQTYCELEVPGEPLIRRYLADKTIPELVDRFGFHYNGSHEISVNIHRDEDPLLFTSTKHGINYDLMDSTMSDKYAEHTLQELERLQAEDKQTKKIISTNLEISKGSLATLTLYDIEAETRDKQRLEYLAYNLSRCETKVIPMVTAPPVVHSYKITSPMPVLCYPKIYVPLGTIPDILGIVQELLSLKSNICPTCGHTFKEEVS